MVIKPVVNSGISTTFTSTGVLARFFRKIIPVTLYYLITPRITIYLFFFCLRFLGSTNSTGVALQSYPENHGGLTEPPPSTKRRSRELLENQVLPAAEHDGDGTGPVTVSWSELLPKASEEGCQFLGETNKKTHQFHHGLLIMVATISFLWLKPSVAYRFHISCLWFQLSFLWFHMSFVWFHIICLWFQLSFLWFHISCLWFQLSFLWFHMSFLWFHISCLWFQLSFLWLKPSVAYSFTSVAYGFT